MPRTNRAVPASGIRCIPHSLINYAALFSVASNSDTMSPRPHTRCESPAAIAGVTRNVDSVVGHQFELRCIKA
jgi:hypothetical protein